MADRTHSHDTSTPAMSAETVPSEEFALVPREPTERMLKAADGWTDLIDAAGGNTPESRRSEFRVAWRAMIAAAPAPNPSPAAKGGEALRLLDGNRPLPFERDELGRLVREAWVRWAETQPNPKPSWLVPYEELSEPDKEADRQIGEAVARWILIGDAALATPSPQPADAVRERIARALNSVLGSEEDEHPRHHPAQNSWEKPSEVWWTQWLEAADAVIAALTPPETAEAVPVAFDPAPATDERERLVEAHVWQSMETAPRDGSHFLAVLHRDGIRDMDGGWMPAFFEVREIWFKHHTEMGMQLPWHAGDPYDTHDGIAPDHFGEDIPIAWMPLPARAALATEASR